MSRAASGGVAQGNGREPGRGVLCCKSGLEGHGETGERQGHQRGYVLYGLFWRAELDELIRSEHVGPGSFVRTGAFFCILCSQGGHPRHSHPHCPTSADIFGFQGAVVNLTREMGLQYAKLGITANALCPGFHITHLVEEMQQQDFLDAMAAYTPMGRIAEAAEIRGPAIFLASAASDFMTGQTLVTDGGCLAGPGVHGREVSHE